MPHACRIHLKTFVIYIEHQRVEQSPSNFQVCLAFETPLDGYLGYTATLPGQVDTSHLERHSASFLSLTDISKQAAFDSLHELDEEIDCRPSNVRYHSGKVRVCFEPLVRSLARGTKRRSEWEQFRSNLAVPLWRGWTVPTDYTVFGPARIAREFSMRRQRLYTARGGLLNLKCRYETATVTPLPVTS